MNYTQAVAKSWENAESTDIDYDQIPVMHLNRSLAKVVRKNILADLAANKGEDILVRVYNKDHSIFARHFGKQHFWKLTRSQVYRLSVRLDVFLSKKNNKRLLLTNRQARNLPLPLVSMVNNHE